MYAGIATRASTLLVRLWAGNDPDAVRSVVASFDHRHDRYESEAGAARRAGVARSSMQDRRDAFAASLDLACRAAVWADPSPVFCNLDDDTLETPADAEPRVAAVIASPAFGAAAAVMATADHGLSNARAAAVLLLLPPAIDARISVRRVAQATGYDAATASRMPRRALPRIKEACRASGVDAGVVLRSIAAAGPSAAERCLVIANESHEPREHGL
ncbi:MAG: hypothetical protein AAGF47_07035 [Planctomycetota bacterium]